MMILPIRPRATNRISPAARPALEGLETRLCPSGGYLMVASYNNDSLIRYDENTGAYVDTLVPSQSESPMHHRR